VTIVLITTVTFRTLAQGFTICVDAQSACEACNVNRWRIILAFIVAPLVVPLVFSAPVLIHFRVLDFFAGLIMLSIYGLPVAYTFELLLGVPAWILFRIFRLKSFGAFALGGAVIGLLGDVILKIQSRSLCDWYLGDILFVVAALGSALVFRAIAFRATTAQVGG